MTNRSNPGYLRGLAFLPEIKGLGSGAPCWSCTRIIILAPVQTMTPPKTTGDQTA